jgi:outer membrane lipopolysaccharide assembly protein LptE/RlpB
MKRRLFFTALALAVLVLAVCGWTVRGMRWTIAAPARAFG